MQAIVCVTSTIDSFGTMCSRSGTAACRSADWGS